MIYWMQFKSIDTDDNDVSEQEIPPAGVFSFHPHPFHRPRKQEAIIS